MAALAQEPQVFHDIRSTGRLGGDVIHIPALPDDSLLQASLTQTLVSQDHSQPDFLPCRAITTLAARTSVLPHYFWTQSIVMVRSSIRPPAVVIRHTTLYRVPTVPPLSQMVADVVVFVVDVCVIPDGTVHATVAIVSTPSQSDQLMR